MNNNLQIKNKTLTSLEVAEMIEKRHTDLLRDVRNYITQMEESGERKIASGDFFLKNTYLDKNNQERPCYLVTKKGCEFIANKLTGIKGTKFTATYINRFHEMEEMINTITRNELEEMKIKAQLERAEAMKINAEVRKLQELNRITCNDLVISKEGFYTLERIKKRNARLFKNQIFQKLQEIYDLINEFDYID